LLVRVEVESGVRAYPFVINGFCLIQRNLLFVLIKAGTSIILKVKIKLCITGWEEANRRRNSVEANHFINIWDYSSCF
jgi:energy-converting hydrogenase Eha subunit G